MVDRIADDGVVRGRSPHGVGNHADGGGAMRISQGDFNKYFWRIQYSVGVS